MSLLNFFGLERLAPAPSDDYWYGPIGTYTKAGVVVNEDVAMTYSACWACTMLLSSAEGMVDFNLYRYLPGGGKEIAEDHPVHKLINSYPNPDMTAVMFRSSRTNHQINRGNGFAEIERDRAGRAINLWPIHASRIPQRNIVREQGRLVYYINNDDGTKTPIDGADMLHIPSLISNDGIWGLGVVTQARLSIGLGIAMETQGASYFGNSASPKIIVKGFKAKAKEDKEDFRRQWNEVHGGPENNGKPAILPEGCDVTALNFSAEDSQFLESRTFNVQDIARWYGVPTHMIQENSRSTYNNIEHQGKEFTTFSLERWNVAWEQEVNRKLLTVDERKTMYCEHVVSTLEPGDTQTRTASNKDRFFNGEINLDEWRQLDGYNPLPGGLGKIHFVQSAMIPLAQAAKGPQEPAPPPPPEPKEDDGLSAKLLAESLVSINGALASLRQEVTTKMESLSVQTYTTLSNDLAAIREFASQTHNAQKQLAFGRLRDVLGRMLSVEINAVKRVAEKPEKFTTRLQEFYDKHAKTLALNLTDPLTLCLTASGDAREAADVARVLAANHIAESQKQLDALLDCQAGELAVKVEECVSKWHERAGLQLPAPVPVGQTREVLVSLRHGDLNLDTAVQLLVDAGLPRKQAEKMASDVEILEPTVIHNHIHVPEAPPPVVNNTVNVPESPVSVSVAAPQVNVESPTVNVAAPSVQVQMPPEEKYDVVPERDRDGNVKKYKRVPRE